MTQKLYFVALITLMLTLSIASAQTLITGKVYGNSSDNQVAEATVKITCKETTLTTKTLQDGTYALRFENSLCSLGDTVQASATRGTLTGQTTSKVTECGTNCEEDYFSIANIIVKDTSSTTYSSSRGTKQRDDVQPIKWFICGNNICDNGETPDTCSKDCSTTQQTTQEPEEPPKLQETQTIPPTTQENKWLNNTITGAAIALGNKINLPIAVAFLAFLIVLLAGHKIIQRKK